MHYRLTKAGRVFIGPLYRFVELVHQFLHVCLWAFRACVTRDLIVNIESTEQNSLAAFFANFDEFFFNVERAPSLCRLRTVWSCNSTKMFAFDRYKDNSTGAGFPL